MNLSEFDYNLPQDRIAQYPLGDRADSRLLLMDRNRGHWEDRQFRELPDLLRGDELVVVNNTRVLPARLFGRRRGIHTEPPGKHSHARHEFLSAPIEVLLTRQLSPVEWEALVRPGRKMQMGECVVFGDGDLEAEVVGRGEFGERRLRFHSAGEVMEAIERLGHVPLPPYINRPDEVEDRERYQSIFARQSGAVAAPTASLHFTAEILEQLKERGIAFCEITLHVGLGTFQPIRGERIEEHKMHREPYEIGEAAMQAIVRARDAGRPILAVGTTVVRALEDAAQKTWPLRAGQSEAEIFIYPGHRFRVVDQMLTNFHLPRSSLLVMVSAFAGQGLILEAYRHAISAQYRFYSYGDCMLIR